MAGEDVTISIGGTAAGAVAAATQANAAVGSISAVLDSLGVSAAAADNRMAVLAASMGEMGDAGVAAGAALDALQGALGTTSAGGATATDALNQLTAAMQQQHDTNMVMQDALDALGPAYADQAAEFLNAATSADDYSARLSYLQAQIQLTTDAQQQNNAAMAENAGGAGALGDAMGGLTGIVAGAISTFAGMMILQTVTGLLNDATTAAENFGQAMFDLNNTVQKEQTSWGYLLGGGGQNGIADASQLMNWSKTASYGVPYTRQDMLQAMTNLMTMPGGLGNQQIEQYLPILADIGATRAPNQSLGQITQAIMGAEMGYSRMLRYDLHINPADLEKYGLIIKKGTEKIENPTQLLPALEGWANANGYGGAAQKISTTTWWGEWSSFIDRIQNFQLTAGGSMFGALQTDLNNLSAWMDKNAGTINTVATDLGNLVGAVVHLGTVSLGSLFKGLQDSGAGESVLKMMDALTGMLGGKGATKGSESLFYTIGKDIGDFVTMIANSGPKIQQFAKTLDGLTAPLRSWDTGALKNIEAAWKNFTASLTPGELKDLEKAIVGIVIGLGYLGSIGPLAVLNGIALALNLMAVGMHELNGLWDAGKAGASALGTALSGLGHWLGQVGGDIASAGKSVGNWFASLPGDAERALSGLGKSIANDVHNFTKPFSDFGDWLYNHNYYVKDFVDAIPKALARIQHDAESALHDYEGMLEGAWTNIKATAQRAWGEVETNIISPVERVFGWVEQRLTQARNWLQNEWNTVVKDAQKAWQQFENAISGEVHTIEQDVQTVINKIEAPFKDLATSIYNAGKNLMDMLTKGIEDNAKKVWDAVQKVASGISKNLGFHSPTEEGPGRDADTWMPNMMRLLSSGIEQHIPLVAQASRNAAESIHNNMGGYGGLALAGAPGGGSSVSNSSTYTASAALGGVHIYGANDEAVSAAIAAAAKASGEQANRLLHQPGGFRQFGQVGSR
jgi:hypothetical protein